MDDRTAAIWFFGILVAFKVVTLVMIAVMTSSWATIQFLFASHLLWIAVAVVLLWAPVVFWIRLVRMRAKRRQLVRAEWQVEDHEHQMRMR